MEAAAGVSAAGRGSSLPVPSSQAPPRKEWRAVSDHHSSRSSGTEELERSKLGQSEERIIYEGGQPLDLEFCSMNMDRGSDNDTLQQRLHSIATQREQLQQMEVELRSQVIARSEIMEMQNNFDVRLKDNANANIKLQEQLHEKEQAIHELERKIEEKERELHAIKLDSEAAWAKEDLLREQNKELASFRRERDNSDAERAQHLKQIHEFQEHVQEKERQFIELQEQYRVAQEAIGYKDEQLREAQAWIARVQDMDALQSNTNHSLQAELRERIEQYNHFYVAIQRQFADIERGHLITIQQLQLELADARERSGTYSEESRIAQTNVKEAPQFAQSNGNQPEAGPPNGISILLPNGNADNAPSFGSTGNSTQTDHVAGVPIAPSSLLGMPTYLPPGQVTPMHPFVMHQQGGPHSVPSHVGHFHSIPAISSLHQWQNQQAVSDVAQVPTHKQYSQPQTEQNLSRTESNYEYEISVNGGQALRSDYLDVHISEGVEPDSVIPTPNEEQVLEPIDKRYLVAPQPQQSLQQISSQFHDALRLNPLEQNSETKEKNVTALSNHGLEGQGLATEQSISAANVSQSTTPSHPIKFNETTVNNASSPVLPGAFVTTGQAHPIAAVKAPETNLLDESLLLACIVRTIPPGSGGRIRISSTLPNRLGKMLAPLHWHDYKKKYGKLDDFVAGYPELFVIEGDYIQLREGAQEIIAAAAAAAKVKAAAVASSSPYPALMPSVAVTPMAQSHRLKRVPSVDSKPVQNQQPNGVIGGLSNVKILSKPKDSVELNGNGHSDRSSTGSSQNRGSSNGRPSTNFIVKQPGRTTGAASTARR